MTTIRSEVYGATVRALVDDPIVQAMADGVRELPEDELNSFAFMTAALREYQNRGGQIVSHIGGVAEAIRQLLSVETGASRTGYVRSEVEGRLSNG
jgi:phage baseplate assembly protein W